MRRLQLPEPAWKVVQGYMKLKFNGTVVRTPYYRNVERVRAELRSLIGKGTPEEIVEDVLIFSKLRGFNLRRATPDEIRRFMEKEGIGIDCSGFVAHVYDGWLRAVNKGSIRSNLLWPKRTLYRKVITILRPIENISSELLTGELNCTTIEIEDTLPGDLIRLKGAKQGDHVVLISTVTLEEDGTPREIDYVHSSPHYGNDNGVKKGKIRITNPDRGLEYQEWLEKDPNGRCITKEGYLRELSDNRLVRPNFMEKIKWGQ